jgi:TrmH family RNA methyltransferase
MACLTPEAVDVVLVRPARLANVGLACRALKAMGLRRLTLVGVSDSFRAGPERGLAYGAWDVLDGARQASSLAEAVAGSVLVVGTSGRPAAGEVVSPRTLAEEGGTRARGGRTSLVFGPEATGLDRQELALCHLTVRIPTHPDQPSLNLAQAVLVLAYELREAAGRAAVCEAGKETRASTPAPDDEPATAGELEEALADFRAAGLGIGYLNPQGPDHILAEWRRLLARASPSRREVCLLRGLARQMSFAAAAVARAPRGAR